MEEEEPKLLLVEKRYDSLCGESERNFRSASLAQLVETATLDLRGSEFEPHDG